MTSSSSWEAALPAIEDTGASSLKDGYRCIAAVEHTALAAASLILRRHSCARFSQCAGGYAIARRPPNIGDFGSVPQRA